MLDRVRRERMTEQGHGQAVAAEYLADQRELEPFHTGAAELLRDRESADADVRQPLPELPVEALGLVEQLSHPVGRALARRKAAHRLL